MADSKISALPAATTPLAGTEVLPIVQGGVTDQVSVANLTAGRAVSALSLTSTNDATINGLRIGKGLAAVATNTAVGVSALAANTTGSDNTAVGNLAGSAITTGTNNSSFGSNALRSVTTASSNNAYGFYAMQATTTGANNVGMGNSALYANTIGASNVAIGTQALNNFTSSNSTAVGYQAAYGNVSGQIDAFGYKAGFSNTAYQSVAIGYSALTASTSGGSNTALGYQAGVGLTTGANNTYLGTQATQSGTAATGEIVICTASTTGKGNNTGYINASGGVYQGNNSASWSVTSDQRIKKNIVDNNVGLQIINQIQVRNFEYRLPEEVDERLTSTDAVVKEGIQFGVIAQELQQVLPDCVKAESTGVLTINTSDLTWYLINAVKELSARLAAPRS